MVSSFSCLSYLASPNKLVLTQAMVLMVSKAIQIMQYCRLLFTQDLQLMVAILLSWQPLRLWDRIIVSDGGDDSSAGRSEDEGGSTLNILNILLQILAIQTAVEPLTRSVGDSITNTGFQG